MISESLEYDPLHDLQQIFSKQESLSDIDNLVLLTEKCKFNLEERVRESNNTSSEVNSLEDNYDFHKLFEKINSTKSLSQITEATISDLTHDISDLDNAKRNITRSMTCFENLKILSDAYVNSKKYMQAEKYIEMCGPFKVMHSLSVSFHEYKSLDEFCKFLNQIHRLESDTLLVCERVTKEVLRDGSNSKYDSKTMKDGICCLADTNKHYKERIVQLCLDSLLYEIKEIFQIDDEAGSLENLSRRYIFFKKVLNNFQSTFSEYFPSEWEIPLKLTDSFFTMTSNDLKTLLKRDLSGTTSIDLFMQSLQTTLEFEKYISVKFSHIYEGKISTCFEPYLKLWVRHQDSSLNAKMLTYLNETKLPAKNESLVVPSSADLFRTYRHILSQTFSLIEGGNKSTIMVELAVFFVKWLNEYYEKILKPLLLPEDTQIDDKNEVVKYTVLLVNTADYCANTIDQLQDKLCEYLENDEPNINKVAAIFEPTRQKYMDLVSGGINLLLNRILKKDLEFVWREFTNTNWANTMVEDYSRYVTTLQSILLPTRSENSTFYSTVSQFNRDLYGWNFIDKTIDLIAISFESQIIKLLKPALPYGTLNSKRQFDVKQVINIAEQLLLDVQLLKTTLHSLPESLPQHDTSAKRVTKHIDSNVEKLMHLLKLLVSPIDPDTTYLETYYAITASQNTNSNFWAFILALKGVPWDLALWKRVWSEFQQSDDDTQPMKPDDLIFNPRELQNFIYNLSRVSDPSWKTFLEEDLKIKPVPRPDLSVAIQSSPSPPTGSPSPKIPGHKLNEIKNLMSNSSFFFKKG
ncbi:Vps53p [Kluyveromyces lactis]|uniref:KLLA0D09394p n=1 Tax=Kluyveromyces lactis (strain ATCC 8585 / CBS 2359 / DSM 70799 / NBRC 1267 / NRRL Y-1140 / WM37) TaxID=284590 RepID=Q6CRF9_KLULA|nr:uncharacterized protein KLLA0_D09394g [Kluyveromyces lactis]CAH00576.1 KLLA0D09394p [Kluyveromyces lactis]|eukprot:XP_453480.1 uncharacterized protein KLLA0_D09394g [Kluyveromyces lactis]